MEWLKSAIKVLGLVSGVGITIYVLDVRRRTRAPLRPGISEATERLLHQGRKKLLASILDVGGFFGADFGGSLAKMVFFLPDSELIEKLLTRSRPQHIEAAHWKEKVQAVNDVAQFLLAKTNYGKTGVRDAHLSLHITELGGTFHFLRFETRRMNGAIELAKTHGLNAGISTICATGGGAHRFAPAFEAELGIHVEPKDEIDCLVKGLAFIMGYVENEAYTFHGRAHVDRPMSGIEYPYLLVNVGSGVGFILVHSETKWERVSGTSLGGGTFYGLCHMLTGLHSFDGMLDLAEDGNNANVDLTVGDIYGGDYNKFGLKSTTIASSFGKAVLWHHPERRGSAPSAPDDRPLTSATCSPEPAVREGHVTKDYYDKSATRALHRITEDAGSFGTEVIGGPGPSRTQASQMSPTSPASTERQEQKKEPQKQYHYMGDVKCEAKDISRSLLIMVSNNIGQLAYLNAVRYKCRHVYFAGNFLRHENTIAMRTLAYAITFWSQGSMEGLFLRHEGYCGAIGAFLSTLEEVPDAT